MATNPCLFRPPERPPASCSQFTIQPNSGATKVNDSQRLPVAGRRKALTVLLRGPQPVMLWLARSMVNAHRQSANGAGWKVLLLVYLADSLRRSHGETALLRNRIICTMADAVLFTTPDEQPKPKHWRVKCYVGVSQSYAGILK
ncbi:MAG: hypothetical protein U0350_26525 [Caldilineaceae bacterium]